MKRIALLLFFVTLSANATTVIKKDYEKGHLVLAIKKVIFDDFDIVKMITTNGIKIDLICGTDFFHNNIRPIIRVRNYFNRVVDDFEIEDTGTCVNLMQDLEKIFEGINIDNKLVFELNLKNRKVDKIIYPDIDPYYQGPYEYYKNDNLNNRN